MERRASSQRKWRKRRNIRARRRTTLPRLRPRYSMYRSPNNQLASAVTIGFLEDGSQREYWQIGIAFRRGRLLGSVTLAGLELSDAGRQVLEGHAADLANRLNNQMTAALSTR